MRPDDTHIELPDDDLPNRDDKDAQAEGRALSQGPYDNVPANTAAAVSRLLTGRSAGTVLLVVLLWSAQWDMLGILRGAHVLLLRGIEGGLAVFKGSSEGVVDSLALGIWILAFCVVSRRIVWWVRRRQYKADCDERTP